MALGQLMAGSGGSQGLPSMTARSNHRNRKLVKSAAVKAALLLAMAVDAAAGAVVTDGDGGAGRVLRAWRITGRAWPAGWMVCVFYAFSSPGRAGPAAPSIPA